MTLRERRLAEASAALTALGAPRLAEMVPSRRDFLQFVDTQKQGVALVARVQRRNPGTGGAWPALDAVAFARACDDADAGAIAVRTTPLFAGQPADLDAIAAAVTAPVLRDDFCLAPEQIYDARLRGADAVVLPGDALDRATLHDLDAVARSAHMATVVDVIDVPSVERALELPTACIGLAAVRGDGWADLAAAASLAARIPVRRTVVLLAEVDALTDLGRLEGAIDAAVIGDVLLSAADPGGVIAGFGGPA